MSTSSDGKQKKLKKVCRRVQADSDANVALLRQMLTANANRDVVPPKCIPGKKWSMVDSGSQPNVADIPKEFPKHNVRISEGQKSGLCYKAADGSLIPNLGESDIVHVEPDGEQYTFTFQNAKVHCPILSVRYLVTRDCTVTFHRDGGHILYPTGKKLSFVNKDGVFFIALNVLDPEPGFARQGP